MQPNKHILFISYDGMTDPLGQSQVIPYLQGLSKAGYEISLLSCEKNKAYTANKEVVKQLLANSRINWHPISYTKKPPVISTIYDVYKLKSKAAYIFKQKPYCMVHTRIGIPSIVGLWLKKKYGILFLNDIREFYADSRVDGGMWNRSSILYNIIYKYFKQQEKQQFIHSDGIVCLTNAAKKIIEQWPEYSASIPLHVIPCSADLQLFNPVNISHDQRKEAALKLGIKENDIIISYLGSIGGWYLTKEMLEFCKVATEHIQNIKFLFISPHRHEQIISHAVKFNIPKDKIITVTAKRNEVPLFLSLSNYSLFFIKPCYSKQSSSPTKHGEIMAMGIPLISNSGVGDVEEIIKSTHSGFVIKDFSNETYKKVILDLQSTQFSPEEIRKAAQRIYSLEKAILSYCELYKKIIG